MAEGPVVSGCRAVGCGRRPVLPKNPGWIPGQTRVAIRRRGTVRWRPRPFGRPLGRARERGPRVGLAARVADPGGRDQAAGDHQQAGDEHAPVKALDARLAHDRAQRRRRRAVGRRERVSAGVGDVARPAASAGRAARRAGVEHRAELRRDDRPTAAIASSAATRAKALLTPDAIPA